MNRYHTFSINHKQSTTQDRKTERTCSLKCTEAEGYEVHGHENQQQEWRQSEGYESHSLKGFHTSGKPTTSAERQNHPIGAKRYHVTLKLGGTLYLFAPIGQNHPCSSP